MNLDLYFKKFEDEMQPTVEKPEIASGTPTGMEEPEDDMDLEDIANL